MTRHTIHLVGASADPVAQPPRTAERQKLAAAIERYNAAQAALDRIAVARERVGERYGAGAAVDRAEEALAEAREREPEQALAEIMGDDSPAGKSVADAEETLRAAQAEAARRRRLHGLLDEEERAVRDELGWASRLRREAVATAIRVDPATIALREAYDVARQRVAEIERQLEAISLALPDMWYAQKTWPDRGSAKPWQAAVESLSTDADAMLPGVVTTESPPEAA